MPTPAPSTAGQELRQRRERLGLTRVSLAALCRCSPAQLGALETGYSPKRSRVLESAERALTDIERTAKAA
jgi:transcriptional regulator with XRE-family HTH domain